jgi:hypothetical protein
VIAAHDGIASFNLITIPTALEQYETVSSQAE